MGGIFLKIFLINSTHEHLPFDHDKGSVAYFKCGLEIIRKYFPDAELISTIQFPNIMAEQFKIGHVSKLKPSNRVFSLWSVINSSLDFLLASSMRFLTNISGWHGFINLNNPLLTRRKKLRAYIDADLVVHLGLDHYSDNGGFITVFEHSKEIIIASLLDKPVALFAQSPGPFQSKLTSWLARKAMNCTDLVIVREDVSLQLLDEAGINGSIKITADPAFLLSPSSKAQVDSILQNEIGSTYTAGVNGTVGLVVSGYNTLSLSPNKSWIFRLINGLYSTVLFALPDILVDKYLRISKRIFDHFAYAESTSCSPEIVHLIDFMVEELDVNVLLISHARGGSMIKDVEVLEGYQQKVKFKEKVKVIRGDYSPDEIKGIIGRCDLLISTKMHACIAAISQGVPTIAIAWSHKYRGIMRSVGQEEYVVSNSIEIQEIIPKVKKIWTLRTNVRRELLKKAVYLKDQALLTGKLIADLDKVKSLLNNSKSTPKNFAFSAIDESSDHERNFENI
jgi:colanic acid/amylovoran biosynthesis protein